MVRSVTLSADLAGCTGDGLVIGADDITVNLNRRTIGGDGVPGDATVDVGIRLEGHHGVVVTNGTVSGFDRGISLDASTGNALVALDVRGNRGRGIMLANHSDGNRVDRNTITDNGRAAIALVDSSANVITGNIASRDGAGVFMTGSTGNTVAGNTITDNPGGIQVLNASDHNVIDHNFFRADGSEGVEVQFSDDNWITHNRIMDTGSGIVTESSDDTVITDNEILHSMASACDGCGIAIQIYGDKNLVARNTVVDAPRYGIELDDFQDPGHTPARDNVIRDNQVSGAGEGIAVCPEAGGVVLNTQIVRNIVVNAVHDGIQVLGPSTGLATSTLTRNTVVHNGNLGIDAVPGVVDGGGNHAAANGNPLQCINITCR